MGETPRTLYQKFWDDHLVDCQPDGTCLIYVDSHLVHEASSAQAFEGLRIAHRKVRRPELTMAVADHGVPTTDRSRAIRTPQSPAVKTTLARNSADHGIRLFAMTADRERIV